MTKSFVKSWTNIIKRVCKKKKRNKLNNALFLHGTLCRKHSKMHNKTDLTNNINYVWSDKNDSITQVWGPAPSFEADFLLIPAKMSINDINIPLYPISTYIGDDHGNHNKNGKVYWSYCKQLDCLDYGDSEVESVINCRQSIVQKIKLMTDKKIKLPKLPKIKTKFQFVYR